MTPPRFVLLLDRYSDLNFWSPPNARTRWWLCGPAFRGVAWNAAYAVTGVPRVVYRWRRRRDADAYYARYIAPLRLRSRYYVVSTVDLEELVEELTALSALGEVK